MHHSILAYICTPGELVVLHHLDADLQDGSPGVVLGIRKGQVEVKLLHSGRSLLVYPENFLDSNEESGDISIADDDYDDFDDMEEESKEFDQELDDYLPQPPSKDSSKRKSLPRTYSDGFSPSKKARMFVPSPSMIFQQHRSNRFSMKSAESSLGSTTIPAVSSLALSHPEEHPLHSSSAGNVFLTRHPSLPEPFLTSEGQEEASHWLRSLRLEIEEGGSEHLTHAEAVLRDILKHHQYCTAAWVELASILRAKGDMPGVTQCINKAVTQCPLKTDFQTFADTIQMYLVGARLLASIHNNNHNNLINNGTNNGTLSTTDNDHHHNNTINEGDNVLKHVLMLPTPPPSALPSAVDLLAVVNDEISLSDKKISLNNNDNIYTNVPVSATSSSSSYNGFDEHVHLNMSPALSREAQSQDVLQCLWLQLRATVRAINVARAAGMEISFTTDNNKNNSRHDKSSLFPSNVFRATSNDTTNTTYNRNNNVRKALPSQVHFPPSHAYLKPFVTAILYEMARILYELALVYETFSRPNNCLAGAHCLLKLCQQINNNANNHTDNNNVNNIDAIDTETAACTVDTEQTVTYYMELLSLVEDKLRDEGSYYK